MEYSRQVIEQYTDYPLEFAEWMGREGFLDIEAVVCAYCGGSMSLHCTWLIFFAQILLTNPTPYLPSHAKDRSQYKDGCVLQCSNTQCRRTRSIRRGSFFHDSNYDIHTQMLIICCFCEDMRVSVCARDLELSRQSVTDYYDNLRGCYADDLQDEPLTFTSPGPFEVDEFRMSHIETEPGRHSTLWIQDICERSTGRYWAEIIPDRSAETLTSNIEDSCRCSHLL